MKTVIVHRASDKAKSGFVAHIGLNPKGTLKESMLPIPVILKCDTTSDEIPAKLINCIPFNNTVPSVLVAMADLKPYTVENHPQFLADHGVKDFTELAFYQYEIEQRG